MKTDIDFCRSGPTTNPRGAKIFAKAIIGRLAEHHQFACQKRADLSRSFRRVVNVIVQVQSFESERIRKVDEPAICRLFGGKPLGRGIDLVERNGPAADLPRRAGNGAVPVNEECRIGGLDHQDGDLAAPAMYGHDVARDRLVHSLGRCRCGRSHITGDKVRLRHLAGARRPCLAGCRRSLPRWTG
jgi:hypothetical protein